MIAIVLCTYNGEKNIRRQVDSILNQSYQDFKLYISDDGSSDSTMNIVSDIAENNPGKVFIIEQKEKHLGAWKHFMYAINHKAVAEADYIMLSDQDDEWLPDKIEKTMAVMKSEEALHDVGTPILVYCDCKLINENEEVVASSFSEFSGIQHGNGFNQFLVYNSVTGAASMMNRALYSLLSNIPEHAVMHDHWIALVASQFGIIKYVNEPLYLYRQHSQNVLGAQEGGLVEEVFTRPSKARAEAREKLDDDNASYLKVRAEVIEDVMERATDGYTLLFEQAKCFLDIYKDKLSGEQKANIERFISIPQMNVFKRIYVILRYRYTYGRWYRTLGEINFFRKYKSKG